MAKTKKISLTDYLDSPVDNYNKNYKVWNNREEWKLVGQVKGRIMEMYNGRQDDCYLINYDNSKAWDPHWNLVEKDYLRSATFGGADDFDSNIKSSMAYRTIATIDAKERRQEIDFLIEARNESDESKGRAITHRYIFEDYFRRNKDIRYKFLEVSKRAKIFGTAIAYVPYTVRIREVQDPVTPDIKEENVKSGELPEIEYKDKTIVDFEDIDFVPWELRDFYVDPNAQNLHGTSHAAIDCAGILYVTPSQVRLMFQGDPDIQNLDKIASTNNDSSFSNPSFKSPRDTEKGFGELIYYYNIETDSEVIIYNEILLKNKPIPYKDKKLPFVAFHFVRHPGHFYGMGIPDIVLTQSSEEAALKNARLDRIKFTTNPPTFIGAAIFGDVDDQWDRIEPNMLIKVADVNQVKPLEMPSVPFDSFRMTEELKDEVVMNTGINVQGMNLPMSSTPATNTLAMKESATDMVNMYSDNLMEGMNHWGWLIESRICQFYSKPTRKAALELGKKEMRELRLEDIDLYKGAEDGNFKTRSIKGSKIIRLDPEMFEWEGTPNIYISPDFIQPLSQAFQMRKAQETLPQLIQLAGDAGTEMASGVPAVINIRKLVKWYLKDMDMEDEDLLLDEEEDRVDEMEQALEQQQKMMEGEDVEGVPGEPKAHKYVHAVELIRINETMAAEEFMQMMGSDDPKIREFVVAMVNYKKALADHLRIDGILDATAGDAALQQSDALDQAMSQQSQPQMGMPMNNMVTIPTVTGNQGLPNTGGMPVPNKLGQEDISGQVATMM